MAPTLLENALKASLFIEQVIVVGENRKHPAALIVPDAVVVEEWCKRHDHAFPGMAGIAGKIQARTAWPMQQPGCRARQRQAASQARPARTEGQASQPAR